MSKDIRCSLPVKVALIIVANTHYNNKTTTEMISTKLLHLALAILLSAADGGHAFIISSSSTIIAASVKPLGWAATPMTASSSSTRLSGTVRPDATDAIAEALRLSEEYGASSPEARVAWDVVEEMDSNDSR